MADNKGIFAVALLALGAVLLIGRKQTPPPGETGSLSGIVTDDIGAPIGGASVTIAGVNATTDSSGNYTVSNLTPGTYTLSVSKSGYGGKSMTISIGPGANTLNVSMNLITGTLSGVVRDASNNAPLPGVTVDMAGTIATTDSNGAYQITGIVPGNYAITFSKAGYVTVSY